LPTAVCRTRLPAIMFIADSVLREVPASTLICRTGLSAFSSEPHSSRGAIIGRVLGGLLATP
jgi:hypothetical protein